MAATLARPTVDRHATALAKSLLAALRPRLAGEARFDLYTRTLYATDASIYSVMPVGVVLPRTEADVHATLAVAREFRVPIVARGAGSSLEGQTTGAGLILDFSKFLHGIVAVDTEARTARVQPGLNLDALNRALLPHGLMFGPDPASGNRATLGGMIGNNSTGAHSILYGMTHDHTRALRVLLSDGTETTLSDLTPEQLRQKLAHPGLEGAVYCAAHRLAATHRDEIARRFPQHWRSVSGYGLNRMVEPEPWNLAQLLVGSEGTLALTLEATVGLVERPAGTVLAIVHFRSLAEAMEAVPRLLEVGPSAIELIDDVMIGLTRSVAEYARRLTFIQGDPACVLVVEFYGSSEAELVDGLARLESQLRRIGAGYATVAARSPAAIADVWAVRKAGLGLLMSTTSQWKPIPFIEDGSVPPAQLPEFVRAVRAILAAHNVEAAFYAHASAGCLHIRPMLNLKQASDVATMRSITEAWGDVIVGLRGSFSGEHGDGRARTEWNEKLFGPTLYGAFCELKDTWDPAGLLNPGSVVRGQRMTENLRFGPTYHAPEPFATTLSFERFGGFAPAVEQCSGVGVCRKTDEGVMCPSYMATREEEHSTRGRANALRGALSGLVPREELLSPRMYGVLDLCLECKACAAECPTGVDMAKIKYEFLDHYYQAHGLPLRNRLFGHIRTLNRLGSATAPLSNWLARSPLARTVQAHLGIARERTLPPFARQSFWEWFRQRAERGGERDRGRGGENGNSLSSRINQRSSTGDAVVVQSKIVLFPDTFTLYNYPEIGIAAVRVIEAAGFEVVLPDGVGCCGRPMISKGMLGDARASLARTVAALLPYARMGLPIVGLEPSCLLTFRDEAVELLRSQEARVVAAQVRLFDEWLMETHAAGALEGIRWQGTPQRLLLHGHCHHKASGIGNAVAALNLLPGYKATLIDAGCCGMAGSFGFEAEHYELSERIGSDRLFPALRANPDVGIAVTGVSCRQQIAHFTGRQPKHLAEWLAEAVGEDEARWGEQHGPTRA